MNYWLIDIISVVVLCVLFTGVLIPQILLVAFRRKLFDEPNERKIHHSLVPRLGGIAFTPVICFSISLILGINLLCGGTVLENAMSDIAIQNAFGFCALFILYLVGMADDLVGVRYIAKFVLQIICAILLIAGGLCVNDLHGVLWIYHIPTVVGVLFTILAVIYIINAINLIDGIDGLASGLSIATTFIDGVAFYCLKCYVDALIAFATLGVLLPFFYFNVFGDAEKKKKIFMGDTGSLTIGIMLAFLTIAVFNIPEDAVSSGSNIFIMAVSPLILPCFDVARVFFHRVRHGRNPFLPDKCHIHHKFLALGLLQWQALVSIVAFDMLFVIINVLMSRVMQPTLIILGDVLLWVALNVLLTRIIRARERRLGKVLYD